MNNFQILTDSVADLPKSWLKLHPEVCIVDTPVTITTNSYNDTFHYLTADDFLKLDAIVKSQNARTQTSQPTVFDPYGDCPTSVETVTRSLLDAGKDVLYVAMNGALSGTFNTVNLLYHVLSEEYERSGRRVICVDSHCMGTGLALLIIDLCQAIASDQVHNVTEMAAFVERNCGNIGHFFTWGELSYIKKSGRVSSIGATAVGVLGIRLVCSAEYVTSSERKLEQVICGTHNCARVRGISRWADIIGIFARRHIVNPTGTIIVSHGNVPRDADIVTCKLMDYLPNAHYLTGPDWRCGAGIQCHGGPTSLHVNFHTDKPRTLEETQAEFLQILRDYRHR